MRKVRTPEPGSRFVPIARAVEETGLPYSLLYSAVKRGAVRVFQDGDASTIFIERLSLEDFLSERLRGGKAA